MLTVSNNGDNPIIALEQTYFQQGGGGGANFGQAMYQSPERSPQYTHDHPRVDLARPLSFGATTFGLFGLYLNSSLSKSVGFVSLASKA